MTDKTNDSRTDQTTVSRRTFVKLTGASAIAMASGAHHAFAQAADTIKIGFISPRTGALAGFGEADPYILERAKAVLAKGLEIGGKTYKVEFIDRDSQSDPVRGSTRQVADQFRSGRLHVDHSNT